jgi:hypothetical protein
MPRVRKNGPLTVEEDHAETTAGGARCRACAPRTIDVPALRPLTMGRRAKAKESQEYDREVADLPEPLRRREFMMRVEAVIYAATRPVQRETSRRSSAATAISTSSSPTSATSCARAPIYDWSRSPAAISTAPARFTARSFAPPARSRRRRSISRRSKSWCSWRLDIFSRSPAWALPTFSASRSAAT